MKLANPQAYELAGKLGRILEGASALDAGASLGMVLGQFILIVETSDQGIDTGIQAIADDAKTAAKHLRSFCQ